MLEEFYLYLTGFGVLYLLSHLFVKQLAKLPQCFAIHWLPFGLTLMTTTALTTLWFCLLPNALLSDPAIYWYLLTPGVFILTVFLASYQKKKDSDFFLYLPSVSTLFPFVSCLIASWGKEGDTSLDPSWLYEPFALWFTAVIAALLLLSEPINDLFLFFYRSLLRQTPSSTLSHGKWIGIFERLVSLPLLILQQYAATIALLGGKSILRIYAESKQKTVVPKDEIGLASSPEDAAEYLFVGTLLSLLLLVLVYVLIFVVVPIVTRSEPLLYQPQ
jgi:hypothetical protein